MTCCCITSPEDGVTDTALDDRDERFGTVLVHSGVLGVPRSLQDEGAIQRPHRCAFGLIGHGGKLSGTDSILWNLYQVVKGVRC